MKKKTITRVCFSVVILGFVFATILSFMPENKKSNPKPNVDMLYVENFR